jgi:hypothetical protein
VSVTATGVISLPASKGTYGLEFHDKSQLRHSFLVLYRNSRCVNFKLYRLDVEAIKNGITCHDQGIVLAAEIKENVNFCQKLVMHLTYK